MIATIGIQSLVKKQLPKKENPPKPKVENVTLSSNKNPKQLLFLLALLEIYLKLERKCWKTLESKIDDYLMLFQRFV